MCTPLACSPGVAEDSTHFRSRDPAFGCRLKAALNIYGVVPYSPLCYPHPSMSHAAKNKEKLIVRARRIRGQVEALERALTEEQDCGDILRLITSARGAMNSLMVELLEDQIRFHVLDPNRKPTSEQAVAADGLVETIKSYLK